MMLKLQFPVYFSCGDSKQVAQWESNFGAVSNEISRNEIEELVPVMEAILEVDRRNPEEEIAQQEDNRRVQTVTSQPVYFDSRGANAPPPHVAPVPVTRVEPAPVRVAPVPVTRVEPAPVRVAPVPVTPARFALPAAKPGRGRSLPSNSAGKTGSVSQPKKTGKVLNGVPNNVAGAIILGVDKPIEKAR